MKRITALLLACLATALPGAGDEGTARPAPVDYNRDVKPILAAHCFKCHGPDAAKRKGGSKKSGGLRLDTPEGATADLGGRRAVAPGRPEGSEMVRRLNAPEEERMPPADTGKRLTAGEVDLLTRWIREGAPYARHWAYVKPVRPSPPAVRDAAWPRNDVDRFILARLEKEGLRPSPEADRAALLRRAALDLTGLPPSLEEAERFAKDPAADAYERAVDRLLQSPAYGEHWARLWLDLARYADSQGYAEDFPRTIWAYRDWVIRALNANLPFDRLTVEQIAGDLIPSPTEDQLQATGFHRNTLTNSEGGTDDEEFRAAAVVDRVNTTLAVWMGTTINCAQCHDHKYDPFSQEEYFRLYAFFNQTEDSDKRDEAPVLPLFSAEQKRQKAAAEEEISRLERTVEAESRDLAAAQGRWEASLRAPIAWKDLGAPDAKGELAVRSDAPRRFTAFKAEGGGDLAALLGPPSGRRPAARIVRIELPGKQRILSLAEVQVWCGPENAALKGEARQSSTAFHGPAKLAIDGNTSGEYFAAMSTTHTDTQDNPWWEVDLGAAREVDRVVVWNRTDGGEGISSRLKDFKLLLLDAERRPVSQQTVAAVPLPKAEITPGGSRALALATIKWTGGTIFALKEPATLDPKSELLLRARGAGRVLSTDDARATTLASLPPEAAAMLGVEPGARTPEQAGTLARHYRLIAPELKAARDRLALLRKQVAEMKPDTTVPVMRDLPPARRRATTVHLRGNFLAKGSVVAEGVPAALHPLPEGEPRNRLGLARWLVHPDNPLTARVIANRLWEAVFGTGLVESSEDFGVRGDPPSHPELLDWLATELVRLGWDVKAFLRLVVTSAAYRQSSRVSAALLDRDPQNRLLARGPRVRHSAEMVRDQALFVSGLLSPRMHGPSVQPPRPKLGLNAAFGGSTDWQTSSGEDRYRRGLYTFWRRTMPYPSMATFDAPSRTSCTIRRSRTNTPLQALVTLNDPVYVEASQALGRKIAAHAGGAREKAAFGFRVCLSRPPLEAEVTRLASLYEAAREGFVRDPDRAAKMATVPLGPAPKDADVADLAAWTVAANVLLNLDEMFMKR